MMQEKEVLIEVFSQNLESLGVKKRKDVDKYNDIFQSVNIFLMNKKNQIFITLPKKSVWPGKLSSSCSGLVRYKETPLEAAKRTLKRELGIEARLILIEEKFYSFEGIKRLISYYRASTAVNPKINKKEIAEGRWLNIEEIENLIAHDECMPPFMAGFELLKKHKAFIAPSPTFQKSPFSSFG